MWVSEQHLTCVPKGSVEARSVYSYKRAMGWMRCKRTSCSSSTALSPAASVPHPKESGFPHTMGAVVAGAAATQPGSAQKAVRNLSRRGRSIIILWPADDIQGDVRYICPGLAHYAIYARCHVLA